MSRTAIAYISSAFVGARGRHRPRLRVSSGRRARARTRQAV